MFQAVPEELASQALTHASWVERRQDSYDRLAFLGDSVLGLAISSDLYPRFENAGAGRLTKLRAQAVSRQACADVARDLGLPEQLRAAAREGGRSADELIGSDRVLASVCEALIGAVYLAFGYERTAPAVVAAFAEQVEEALDSPDDFKSLLQERLARRGDVVDYVIVREDGPPHDRQFESVAQVEGEEIGRGEGKSKKSAEQSAALAALTAMDND
ncbi:MAG: ribonuclease III [Thermoleophilaceae bacterium]